MMEEHDASRQIAAHGEMGRKHSYADSLTLNERQRFQQEKHERHVDHGDIGYTESIAVERRQEKPSAIREHVDGDEVAKEY